MRKRVALCLALLLCLTPILAFAAGNDGTANYIYSYWGEVLPVPPAYTLSRSLTANLYEEIDSLAGLSDAYVTENEVFILCQTRLIVMDHRFNILRVQEGFEADGREEGFAGNSGIFVTEAGDYYITQADRGRILHFEPDGTLRRALARPEIVGFEGVGYRPTKLVADSAGRLFVIAKGMYEGIVELRPDGSFSRFYGVNEVEYNFIDLIWRTIATEAQRARMPLWLPSDFTSLAIDENGFIFATIQGESLEKPVLRLNAKGENILKVPKEEQYPIGDLWRNMSGAGIPTGSSTLIDVDTNASGMFLTLDGKRARVFGYNEDGKLLFIFGGLGDRQGYFRNPIGCRFVGDQIIVLDQLAQSVEVFAPTDYGTALLRAVDAQHRFDQETAKTAWREVLDYNPNMTIAYAGLGRALLREKAYDEALDYLRLGNDRKYYTKAYEKVRNETLREWFVPGIAALAGLLVLTGAGRHLYRKSKSRGKEAAA